MFDFNFLLILLFIIIFFIQTLRKQQYKWLWLSIMVWISLSLVSAQILPRILGMGHLANLYLVNFYLFIGSVFFFSTGLQQVGGKVNTWQNPTAGRLLTLIAISGVSMHLSLLIFAGLVWWQYPSGNTPFVLSRLVIMYALDPLFWYGSQILLMIVFMLHRWIARESVSIFSLQQIYVGTFLCLIWQFLYTINFYVWLPKLIQWLILRYL